MPISRGDIGRWDVFRRLSRPVPISYISIPIGLNNAFGDVIVIADARRHGYNMLLIEGLYDNIEGSFAPGEVLTVRRIAYYDDGSIGTLDRTYSSTGLRLYAEGMWEISYVFRVKPVVAVGITAMTNMSTTSVTLKVAVSGYMV
jgi:hypothetical protein